MTQQFQVACNRFYEKLEVTSQVIISWVYSL